MPLLLYLPYKQSLIGALQDAKESNKRVYTNTGSLIPKQELLPLIALFLLGIGKELELEEQQVRAKKIS